MILSANCVFAGVLSSDKGVMFSQDRGKEVLLNGDWKFKLVEPGAYPSDFYETGFDDSQWGTIPVPGCWDALGLVEPKYNNPADVEGLYRTEFKVPSGWLGKSHVFLRFDGVLRGYEIWVNGQFAGKWESAYNSCHFDVTPYVHAGVNELAVRNYVRFKGFDFDSNDDWGQIGINRSVSVFPVPENHISDIVIETGEVSEGQATIRYKVLVGSFGDGAKKSNLRLKIRTPDGKKVYKARRPVGAGETCIVDSIVVPHPDLWTAETPDLYMMTCRVGRKDRQSVKFGIREIRIDGDVLLLNGKNLKLRGVCYHDTDPFTGKVISRERLLQDLEMMKRANINFIRCSHYPKAPEFYDACDSMGFYVMDEVPFGFGDRNLYDESFQDILLTRAEATVGRDKNHPSVIVWSVGNENPLTEIAAETGRYVKRLDPARPICYPMVHDYFLSLNFDIPEFVDIFAPHYPPVGTLQYYAENASRPVICTEYCHSLGQSLEQQDELWELMQSNDNLAGGAVWEWCDQGMVDRNAEYPGRFARTEKLWLADSTCITMKGNEGTDGIIYADRTPLSNYYEVRHNYSQARVLTDTIVCKKGKNEISLDIDNRYDFIDLSDDVYFLWSLKNGNVELDSGRFDVECAPGETVRKALELGIEDEPGEAFMRLEVIPCSSRYGQLGLYSIPVVSEGLTSGNSLLSYAGDASSDFALPEIMLRIGRKKGLAESIRAKTAPSHYLVRPDSEIAEGLNEVGFSNEEFESKGTVSIEKDGAGYNVSADVRPVTEEVLLLEAGLAFRFGPEMEYVQWVGNGPYASYPGKNKADVYGCHASKAGDLYFEGNRMGVDAAFVSDAGGNGYLLVSKGADMNFENTDEGLIVSVNDKVSGLCGKLRKTSYPVMSSADDPIHVELRIMKFDIENCPEALSALFVKPEKIEPFNPFIARYDDFELPLKDIL